jgi:mRNA-degrading endonuclease RelE of RelBE toxin-antitoxin system
MLKVVLHRKALKELESLTPSLRERIVEALTELGEDPFRADVKPIGAEGRFQKEGW